MKRLIAFLSALFVFALIFPLSSGPAAASDTTSSCTQSLIPVTLSALDPTVYHVATWLCSQGHLAGKTVQVLVHGSTYDHTYWDFPSLSPTDSYVKQITSAGYVTLNLDRIGTGLSDHPPALHVTLVSNAYVLHQIIQSLRNGSVNGVSFSKIILVGHSFGSTVVITEASQYGDAVSAGAIPSR
ncbi:MAG TPA: alpha/beta fold hydrolase [Ktedonosporobacter sp.]|nr:alpha/beta fold hydrolase [Ktedonosporobacter sp.]